MVANQILQATVDKYAQATGVSCSVFDTAGKPLAFAGEKLPLSEKEVAEFHQSGQIEAQAHSCLLRRGQDEPDSDYIVAIGKGFERQRAVVDLLAYQIDSLAVAYREKFDQDNFIKNLLLDNLLLIDIYNRAKKLRIALSVPRAVLVLESKGKDSGALYEMVRQIFSGQTKDFITNVEEEHLVVVHEITDPRQMEEELYELAADLEDRLQKAAMPVCIGIGGQVGEIREVSKSYKEAKLALDVRRIFYDDESIVSYERLGIGRLIYQLPMSLCHMFISEVIQGRSASEFDSETLLTIEKFFENSLNVSETSRQLFIHRNTLVYRLDKLQKMTGLDLRTFDDAITFKIAMMVAKYMEHMEKSI